MRRLLLILLLLALPAAPAVADVRASRAPAPAAAAEASLIRAGDQLELRWTGLAEPVSVMVWPAPDRSGAPRAVLAARGGAASLEAPPGVHPLVVLRAADGLELPVASRLLALEGGQNFRDLGGYAAADGQRVRWGQLYRSGVMSELTANDLTALSSLGIATVCDLRSTDERTRDPQRFADGAGVDLLQRDYALDMRGFGAMFASGSPTAEKARSLFADFYRDIPFQFADDYARMMRALVEGRAPLAFNCSAGKDRTGVAAALLLTVLGVDRETAIADYLLSNEYYRPKPPEPGAEPDPSTAMFAQLPPDVRDVFMGVDRAFLEAAFAAIDERPGGMAAYIRDSLGLSDADVRTLRARYLEPLVRNPAPPGPSSDSRR